MNKSFHTTICKTALFLFLVALVQTSYSQSYCKIFDEIFGKESICKLGDEYLILQSTGSIWRSTDEINWTEDIIEEFSDSDVYGTPAAMAFFDESNGVVASFSNPDASKASLYHTADGGLSWTRSKLMLEDGSEVGFFPYQLHALDDQTILMTQLFTSRMYISYNRGTTWTEISGYSQGGGIIMDVAFIDKDEWYVPTINGLYQTTDQLESAELLIDFDFFEFYANADSPKMYGVTWSSGSVYDLYFSEDEFSTWESIRLNDVIPDMELLSNIVKAGETLYLIEGDNMHYSNDDGQTWTNINLDQASYYGFKTTDIDGDTYSFRGSMLKFDCMTVGIDEDIVDGIFEVYPNPTNGILYIDNPNHHDLQLSLFDVSGRQLMECSYSDAVDVSAFENGLYFMHIVNQQSNEKVVERVVLVK